MKLENVEKKAGLGNRTHDPWFERQAFNPLHHEMISESSAWFVLFVLLQVKVAHNEHVARVVSSKRRGF